VGGKRWRKSQEGRAGEGCERERSREEIARGIRGRDALEKIKSQEESREGSAGENRKKEVLVKNAVGNRGRKSLEVNAGEIARRIAGTERWRKSQDGVA